MKKRIKMEVKKGDKVLFYADGSFATGAGKIPKNAKLTFGIVKEIASPSYVDMLCQGKGLDYRVSKNGIVKRLGNVFEENEG